jgi:hypothetical protein
VSSAQLKLLFKSVILFSSIENNHPILSKIHSQNHFVSSESVCVVSQFNQSTQSLQFTQSIPLIQSIQLAQSIQSNQSAQVFQ